MDDAFERTKYFRLLTRLVLTTLLIRAPLILLFALDLLTFNIRPRCAVDQIVVPVLNNGENRTLPSTITRRMQCIVGRA